MRGFAVIDHRPGQDVTVVWHVGQREADLAGNTNAVTIRRDNDADAERKLVSLTRLRATMLTEGSHAEGLPVSGHLTADRLATLRVEVEERQEQLRAAVRDRAMAQKTSLVPPPFSALPPVSRFEPQEDTAKYRALATANHLAKLWTAWLETEAQRLRRTDYLPEPLNGADPAVLPPGLAADLSVEPEV